MRSIDWGVDFNAQRNPGTVAQADGLQSFSKDCSSC